MGLESSKQQDQMINSLNRMRKDVRNGKIKPNQVEGLQHMLNRYSQECEQIPNIRQSNGYTISELITITSQELDGLKEVNQDNISQKSFKRNSKNFSKEKRKSVKSITDSVINIRKQIRSTILQPNDFEKYQKDLADFSQELCLKSGKKTENEAAQKLVSSVIHELFIKQQETDNPSRSGSLRRSKEKRISFSDNMPSKFVSKSTLDDIENKLSIIQEDITVAKDNKDKNRLRFLLKSIQTLMTDLQMIDVSQQALKEQRKELLESNLKRAYQDIEKLKRKFNDEHNLKQQSEIDQKERSQKNLEKLDEIQNNFLALGRTIDHSNFQAEKKTFLKYQNQLISIGDTSEDVSLKKAEINGIMNNVESVFAKIEMNERLNQAESRHCQYKFDIQGFQGTTESAHYQKHREYLIGLEAYVKKISEIDQKIEEKKKYILYNIENNIRALDAKARDNMIKSKGEEVTLQTSTVPSKNFAEDVCASNESKSADEEKSSPSRAEPDLLLVTVKEKQLEPQLTVISRIEIIQKEVEAIQLAIENSRYTKETQFYKDAKSKLTQFRNEAVELSTEMQDTTSIGDCLNYIDSLFQLLENNTSSRKSTTEDILINIMTVSTRVTDLSHQLQHGTIQDLVSFKKSLLEEEDYLKNLSIASNRNSLLRSRSEILKQIQYLLSAVEKQKESKSKMQSKEQEQFMETVKNLKSRVSRFSGTYRNVLYQSIEKDLNKCIDKLETVFEESSTALKIRQDVENAKLILEQKAMKDQPFKASTKQVHDSFSQELQEIRQNVQGVKNRLSQVEPLTKDDLDSLDAKMTLSVLALGNVKVSSAEKQQVYNDIKSNFEQIQQMNLVNETQASLQEQPSVVDIVASIQNNLEKIRPEVESFIGTESDPKFLELDEILINGTLELDKLNLDQNSELHRTKIKLITIINEFSDILDERINQTQAVENFENDVRTILIKIDSFNGSYGDADFTYFDEEIIRLKIQLGKLRVCPELAARREAIIKEIHSCMRKLNEAAKNRNSALAGTLV